MMEDGGSRRSSPGGRKSVAKSLSKGKWQQECILKKNGGPPQFGEKKREEIVLRGRRTQKMKQNTYPSQRVNLSAAGLP